MSRLAIIPARGGSKRIPRKNIKEFCGKPILAYSVEAALKSNLFDEVMVSTDDEEIAEVAKRYGASVPFYRSEKTANDYAILKDVMTEVLSMYKERGKEFDEVCCILSTAPFVTADDLQRAHKLMEENASATAVLPVVKYSYTIFRSLQKNADGKIEMFWPENFSKRSQDLPEAFHDAGLFYWYRKQYFQEKVAGFGEHSFGYEISESKAQDIDTYEDWAIAEEKYMFLNNKIVVNHGNEEFKK